MHDIRSIREAPAAFDEGLKRRGLEPVSAEVLKRDAELRALLTRLQTAQARRNEASKLIGQAKAKKDDAQAQALMAEVAGLKDQIQKGEEEERRLQAAVNEFLAGIPNLPADYVPVGADEHANVEIRRWGEKPKFDFKPKEHFDLGEGLRQMDFEAAARMSGARFVVLKGHLARLERAIAQFMLDLHTEGARENNPTERIEIGGYTEVSPPLLVRDRALYGTSQLPKFEEDLFFTDPRESNWLADTMNFIVANAGFENHLDDIIYTRKEVVGVMRTALQNAAGIVTSPQTALRPSAEIQQTPADHCQPGAAWPPTARR